MRIGLVIIVLLTFLTPAVAQFEPLAFAVCKKIATDTARLKCFDEIGAYQDKKPVQTAEDTKWSYEIDKSPVDDSDQVLASMKAGSGATLVMRCREQATEVAFIPGGFFVSGMTPRIPTLVRLNEDKPLNVSWAKSSNGQAAFAPNAVDFIRSLNNNGRLYIRIEGFEGRQFDGLFNLADVSVARQKIEDACKWSTPKSAKLPVAGKK